RLRAVPRELEPIAVRVAQVKGLVGSVVVVTVERPPGGHQPAEGVAKRAAGRVFDRHVIEAGRAGGRGIAALRLPGVDAKVMVVAACGRKERGWMAPDDVGAKDVDVEVVDAVDVCGLEVYMADRDCGIDGVFAPLERLDACGGRGFSAHRPIQRRRVDAYSAATREPARRTRIEEAAMLTTTAPIKPALISLVMMPAPSASAPST